MKPSALREGFLRYMTGKGHHLLPERSLIGRSNDTFYTIAAATNVTGFVRGEETAPHPNTCVVQRTFSASQLEFAGRYPLATPLEVQMSIFRFEETTPQQILELTLHFLERELDLECERLYCLTPREYGVLESLRGLGFPESNVVTWAKPLAYYIGDQGPSGHYVRLFLKYRHGLFPVVDLTFIRTSTSQLIAEACFYLERLYFSLTGEPTWFSTPLFQPLVYEIKRHLPEESPLSTAHSTAVFLRALVALIGDGLDFAARGPGHVPRKMIRQLMMQWWGQVGAGPYLPQYVDASLAVLKCVGYDYGTAATRARTALRTEEELAKATLSRAEEFLVRQAPRFDKRPVTVEQLAEWRDSRGIPEQLALSVLRRAGVNTDPARLGLSAEEHFYLKMSGFPYSTTNPIESPSEWLRQAENLRYARRT